LPPRWSRYGKRRAIASRPTIRDLPNAILQIRSAVVGIGRHQKVLVAKAEDDANTPGSNCLLEIDD